MFSFKQFLIEQSEYIERLRKQFLDRGYSPEEADRLVRSANQSQVSKFYEESARKRLFATDYDTDKVLADLVLRADELAREKASAEEKARGKKETTKKSSEKQRSSFEFAREAPSTRGARSTTGHPRIRSARHRHARAETGRRLATETQPQTKPATKTPAAATPTPTPAASGPITVAQQMEALNQQAAAKAPLASRFGTGVASFLGGGLAALGYEALIPQEYRDWASRTGFQFNDTTDVNLDNVGQFAAFEAGAAIPSVAINRMTGGALGTPAGVAARGFLPSVLGGLVGSQQGAETARRTAETFGLGDTGQAIAGFAGSIPGFIGGRNVATNLMTQAGRQSISQMLRQPLSLQGLQSGMKGFGTKLGAVGAIADTAFTAYDQYDTKYKGLGGELADILDPADLLALSGGPVGVASLVATKGLKVGGAISRGIMDAEQQERNKIVSALINATLVLNNTDWSKQPAGAKEQWQRYAADLQRMRDTQSTFLLGDEKKQIAHADLEGKKNYRWTYNPETKKRQFQSDVADDWKRRAEEKARESGAKTAAQIDAEQAGQIATLTKQAGEAPKTAEGRTKMKEVETKEQSAQRFAAQDAVRQAIEAGYEPDPELLKQAEGPIEKDPNQQQDPQELIDAEVGELRDQKSETLLRDTVKSSRERTAKADAEAKARLQARLDEIDRIEAEKRKGAATTAT